MSVRELKKKSRTDWERIDKMTDEEIDTSDIPLLNEAFFRSAKWLLPRWCIDLGDFRQAKEFAQHILKRKWQPELNETPVQRLEHTAFNTSLIVSYARPFHNNKTLKGAPESSLRNQVGEVLNEAEVKLHDRVLRLSDTVIASDGRALGVFSSGFGLTFLRVVENLSESEVRLLKGMTNKWIDHLGIESSKLKRRLAQAVQRDRSRRTPVQNHVRAKR
jgi:hypothetical protein